MNARIRSDNKSGITGVSFNSKRNKWCAEIQINKRKIKLGSFSEKQDAINARKEAEELYFGEWSYNNSKLS